MTIVDVCKSSCPHPIRRLIARNTLPTTDRMYLNEEKQFIVDPTDTFNPLWPLYSILITAWVLNQESPWIGAAVALSPPASWASAPANAITVARSWASQSLAPLAPDASIIRASTVLHSATDVPLSQLVPGEMGTITTTQLADLRSMLIEYAWQRIAADATAIAAAAPAPLTQ